MQHLFRSRPSTSAVAASKSVSVSISYSGCLLRVAGERGNRLRRTTEQKSISTAFTEKNDTARAPAPARGGGCWKGSSGRRPMDRRTEQSAFKRRLGEFYARFYSAISEAAQSREYDKSLDKDKDKSSKRYGRRDVPTIAHDVPIEPSLHQRSTSKATHLHNGATPVIVVEEGQYNHNSGHDGGMPWANRQFKSQILKSSDTSAVSLISTYDPTAAARPQQLPIKKRVHRPQKRVAEARYLDSSKIEEAAVSITNNLIQHNTLGLELLKVHNQRLRKLARESGDWASRAMQRQDIEMLRNTLKYINNNSVADTAIATASITGKQVKAEQRVPDMGLNRRQYAAPFPRYTSTKPPIALNNALQALLTRRPVLQNMIPKVCYNLLTSYSAPDASTYNILLRNLVLLRKNALAELVFQEMVVAGEAPDIYTIVALLELMVKSGDFEGWRSVARLQHKEEKGWLKQKDRVRSKYLLESLIIHAARFGRRDLIRRYTRALRNYWPQDPEPGREVLTALIRFYCEKQEWKNGRYCWVKLFAMDEKGIQNATESDLKPSNGEVLDERAWYWWLRHCRACGMESELKKWAAIAKERGVDTDRLLAKGPNKLQGLHVRARNKSPMLIQYDPAGDLWEEQRVKKQEDSCSIWTPPPQITETEKREILGSIFYERLYGPSLEDPPSQDKIPMPNKVQTSKGILALKKKQGLHMGLRTEKKRLGLYMDLRTEKKRLGLHVGPKKEEKQENAPDLTRHEKSHIWGNIVVTRMDMLLRRHKAQEIKEYKGEIRITDEERKRGQILSKWKEGIGDERDATILKKTPKDGALPVRGRRVYH
ncbi:hypothetical protein EV426DRAFT_620637 [Tirmania nivea]|nr:hypothetical protein EV426DRAFT_620637 [Tirmania nivea]